MTLAAPPTHTIYSAIQTLPNYIEIAAEGLHSFGVVRAGDWYALVGPDAHDDDLEWVTPLLPAGDWTATFETFDWVLVTHFTRHEEEAD